MRVARVNDQERDNLWVWAAKCVRDVEPFPIDLHARLMEQGKSPELVEAVLCDVKEQLDRLNDIRDEDGVSLLDVLMRPTGDEDEEGVAALV